MRPQAAEFIGGMVEQVKMRVIKAAIKFEKGHRKRSPLYRIIS